MGLVADQTADDQQRNTAARHCAAVVNMWHKPRSMDIDLGLAEYVMVGSVSDLCWESKEGQLYLIGQHPTTYLSNSSSKPCIMEVLTSALERLRPTY